MLNLEAKYNSSSSSKSNEGKLKDEVTKKMEVKMTSSVSERDVIL